MRAMKCDVCGVFYDVPTEYTNKNIEDHDFNNLEIYFRYTYDGGKHIATESHGKADLCADCANAVKAVLKERSALKENNESSETKGE